MYRKFKKVVLGLLEHVTPSIFLSRILRSEAFVYSSHFFQNSHSTEIMHQSIPAAPSPSPPPPGLLRGICAPCQSRGWGISKFCAARGPGICQPRGQNRAFDTHAVFCQHITTQRILMEKQADRLICQGREKIEEVCKGMFSILCMHFFIAYQARIT